MTGHDESACIHNRPGDEISRSNTATNASKNPIHGVEFFAYAQ